MPVRYWILRVLVAVLCVAFAHFWGRSAGRREPVRVRRGTGTTSWTIRTLLAAAALQWGAGTDPFAIAVYAAAALAWAGGFLWMRRRKKPDEENLTRQMFPDE